MSGKSVLDIGCALGDLLFTAERRGASRLVGVELHDGRYSAAQMLRGILCSRAEFHNCDFATYASRQRFDHVFSLNVIHHIRGIHGFLAKAASLAKSSLTLEFPTLVDNKFLAAHGLVARQMEGLDSLPLIGLSSIGRADQTYVYSTRAIKNLVCEEIGGFEVSQIIESPIVGRAIIIFVRPGCSH